MIYQGRNKIRSFGGLLHVCPILPEKLLNIFDKITILNGWFSSLHIDVPKVVSYEGNTVIWRLVVSSPQEEANGIDKYVKITVSIVSTKSNLYCILLDGYVAPRAVGNNIHVIRNYCDLHHLQHNTLFITPVINTKPSQDLPENQHSKWLQESPFKKIILPPSWSTAK